MSVSTTHSYAELASASELPEGRRSHQCNHSYRDAQGRLVFFGAPLSLREQLWLGLTAAGSAFSAERREEARRRLQDGEDVRSIARAMNVSTAWVYSVCGPRDR